jgi:Zn-dependent protease with chaperone function
VNSSHSTQALQIPPGFTGVSFSYRLRVWAAMLGLVLFLLLYVGLAGWFTYTAYRMIAGVFAGGDGAVAAFFAAIPSGFLAIFMWKALFFVREGSDDPGVEITADDQPELFAFLYELADEIGAPRPHRVFLSPNVNACVFYDLSILNFFLPSKKNLIIGLGLVNVVTRSEFRAVLAHEFGHFAQRSMAVGRWVYVGEQIAAHIIAKRDALDRTLDFISHIDLRVAWIGWIMRTIVWSIRSLMETAFRWVVIAHRALSREMEFQADLVAVSVTGSDALIDALYRLQPADEDWERSLSFTNAQLGKGRKVTDLFEVQTRIGQHMRRVLNEPNHGMLPEDAGDDPAERRLFTEQIAQPPRMWSTHPPNTEREENAKRTYIAARREREPAWMLFADEQRLRESATAFVFQGIKFENEPEPMSSEEAMAALDESFSHESYDTRYQGTYLGRPVAIGVPGVRQLYGEPPAVGELARCLEELYPKSLHDLLTQWRNLEEEIASLEAIESGYFDATGGVIRHRGEVIPRTELSEVISRVKQERDDVVAKIEEHDQNCRTVHQMAAEQIGHGWPEYLKSLTALLHYAEHGEAELNDAHGHLANITMMSTAGGRVSKKKLQKILASANDLHSVMFFFDEQTEKVDLPEAVSKELEVENWRAAIEKLQLPPANEQNIGQWMQVIDGWAIPMIQRFGGLRRAVLAELLRSERNVADFYRGQEEPTSAPKPAVVPEKYPLRPRGSERVRQTKLDWWSRFTLADGLGPGLLRFVVASTIVAAVVLAGLYVGGATVTIYNGLAIPVNVAVHNQKVKVLPLQHKKLSVGARRSCLIVARTEDGREIEAFTETLDKAFANYVYNVAGAAPMVEWERPSTERRLRDNRIFWAFPAGGSLGRKTSSPSRPRRFKPKAREEPGRF